MQWKDFQPLRECPFCEGRSIMVKTQKCGRYVGCLDCGARTEEAETDYAGSAYDKAIAAWNRRAQPGNEALTLDELRQMDGEPVWVIPINLHEWICDARDGKPEWGMARKSWVRIWRSETADLMHTDFDFEDYGKIWLAYRHKPERSEG